MKSEITERQQEIINASLDLIAESGIQSLTIKNLAQRIGFSESALYRHYENKIQILVAILDYFKDNTAHFFTNELNENCDAITKVDKILRNHFLKFSTAPSLVSVIFSEEIFRNEIELIDTTKNLMNGNLKTLESIIETGQKKGEIRNDIEASDLSLMIIGSLRLFVKKWQLSDYEFDIVERGSSLIDSIKLVIKA